MKTKPQIEEIVSHIGYKDGWRFRLEGIGLPLGRNELFKPEGWEHEYRQHDEWYDDQNYDHYFLQACFIRTNTWNGETAEEGRGRKWLISPHMTESEIVLTALKACITNEEHEAREAFTYMGAKIAHPHPDISVLVTLAEEHDVRTS